MRVVIMILQCFAFVPAVFAFNMTGWQGESSFGAYTGKYKVIEVYPDWYAQKNVSVDDIVYVKKYSIFIKDKYSVTMRSDIECMDEHKCHPAGFSSNGFSASFEVSTAWDEFQKISLSKNDNFLKI